MIKLREYQKYSVDKYFEHIEAGHKKICVAIPAGCGKTYVSAAIAERYIKEGRPVIFIAPRISLVNQTISSFEYLGDIQIIQGKKEFSKGGLIYIASLQTLVRRELGIDPGLIIVDEKHIGHQCKSHKKILDAFPEADHLSLTATPFSPDGIPLKGFDKIIKYKNIRYFIDNNYLVDCICYSTATPDLSKVRKTKDDYNEQDLDHVMNNSSMIGEIVNKTKDKIKNKKCLFFATSISHAENIAKEYKTAGFKVELYHSKLKDDFREKILKDFKNNKIDILVSVTALIAGFDESSIDCLIIGRPIRSMSFLRQLYGRGMRIHKGKLLCYIYDCTGSINSTNLPSMEVIPRRKQENKSMHCEICKTKAQKYAISIRKVNEVPNYVTTWKCKRGHYFESLKEIETQICKKCSKILHKSEFRETPKEYEIFIKCDCGEEKIIRKIIKNSYKLKKIENAGLAKIKEADLLNKLEDQSKEITKLKDLIIQKIHPDLQYSCLLALHENKELESKELQKKLTDVIVSSALETNQFECISSGMLKSAYNKTEDPINIVCMHNQRAKNPMKLGWLTKTKKEIYKAKKVIDNGILLKKTKDKCRDINQRNQKMASLFYFFENLTNEKNN